MPLSIRLDPHLEARLRAIADNAGIPLSEVVRRAAVRYIDEVATPLHARLADAIGVVRSGGGRAKRSGDAFKQLSRQRK